MAPLKIGCVPEHFNLPLHDTLAKLPTKFQIIEYPGGTGAMNVALNNKEIDVAFVLTEGGLKNALENSSHIKIVSTYVNSPLVWGIHVAGRNEEISSVRDLKSKKFKFAISRVNSGSHLMSLILAQQLGLNLSNLQFEIVHDLKTAKVALPQKNSENLVFLWEKAMTSPLVEEGTFKRIGLLPTPWPCFLICCREGVNKQALSEVLDELNACCVQFKKEKNHSLRRVVEKYKIQFDLAEEWFDNLQYFHPSDRSAGVLKSMLDEVKSTLSSVNQISKQANIVPIENVLLYSSKL